MKRIAILASIVLTLSSSHGVLAFELKTPSQQKKSSARKPDNCRVRDLVSDALTAFQIAPPGLAQE